MKTTKKLILSFLFLTSLFVSAKSDEVMIAKHFTNDKTPLVNQIEDLRGWSDESLKELEKKHPGIDLQKVRFATPIKKGDAPQAFAYKVDKTYKVERIDSLSFELSIFDEHRSANDYTYYEIYPEYYYGNDFEYVQTEEVAKSKKSRIASAIILGCFSGVFSVGGFGAARWLLGTSENDSGWKHFSVIIIPVITCGVLTYRMYSEKVNAYMDLTEDEYIAVRQKFPELDCDTFKIIDPIKNSGWRIAKYFGGTFLFAATGMLLKEYASTFNSAK